MNPRRRTGEQSRPPMVPEEQYGPWKGMRPPHTNPSAVPADRYQRPSRPVPFRDVLAGFPSAMVFLSGVWLLVVPFLIEHPGTAAGVNAVWNDVGAGLVLVVLGATRAVSPFSTLWAGWLTLLVGGWLIAAPYVLGYRGGDAAGATANDVVVGAVVIGLTVVGLLLSLRWRGAESTRREGEGERE